MHIICNQEPLKQNLIVETRHQRNSGQWSPAKGHVTHHSAMSPPSNGTFPKRLLCPKCYIKYSCVFHSSEMRVMKIKRYKPTNIKSEVWEIERWQRVVNETAELRTSQHNDLPKGTLTRSKPGHPMDLGHILIFYISFCRGGTNSSLPFKDLLVGLIIKSA